VIHRGQVWVGVVPEGPSGIALNSKFDNRNSVEYRQSLGHSLGTWHCVVDSITKNLELTLQ
jgi:hypothetical protein